MRFGFAESSTIVVDLVPPPDDSDHPAKYFRRKFLQALIADDEKPGWHGVVVPGTLLEVADYLWQHQELYLHMHSPEQNANPDDAPMVSKHISVAFSEILDPDDLLASAGAPYVKRMTFSDDLPEALTITLRLEAFSIENPPPNAPPVPMTHAFALQIRPRMDLDSMQKLGKDLMPSAEAGNGEEEEQPSVIVQYGAVQQHLHLLGEDVQGSDLSHFHLVLVENWAELAMWSQTLAKVQIYIPANGGSESRCCNLDLLPIVQAAKRNRGSPTNEPFDVTCHPEGQEFGELGFHCELGPLALDGLSNPNTNADSVNRPFMSPETLSDLSPFKQELPQQSEHSQAREVLNALGSEIHNWRVSVEVKSVKLLVDTGSVYCKYLYPPFRQTKAFKTNPPVPARKNATVHLPSPFCQYSLPMMADELRDALSSGLRLEIWNRDAYKTDTCLGTATIDVKKVADANFACVGTKRDDNQYVITGRSGCIGSVRVVLYLEDAGAYVFFEV